MFESVDTLSRRLPRPAWTGNPRDDQRVSAQYIANGQALRNEAVASLGRAFLASLRHGWQRLTQSIGASTQHQS